MRNIWRRRPDGRRVNPLRLIYCTHSGYRTPCQLRMRPGDTRKSCWEVCHNCGKYLACSNC